MPQRGRENAESAPADDGGLHVSDQFLLDWVSMGASLKGLLFKKVVGATHTAQNLQAWSNAIRAVSQV